MIFVLGGFASFDSIVSRIMWPRGNFVDIDRS